LYELFKHTELFHKRLSELRILKGVSAREMSLSLGQSESYINKIENKRTLPSISGFIYICEYLGITPQEFFDYENETPQITNAITQKLQKLSPEQAEHILALINDFTDK